MRAQQYPNNLRSMRDAQGLTRHHLSTLCERLFEADQALHTRVGYTTIQNLERGLSQPRASTARTLAEALDVTITEIFPLGIDLKSRHR